MCLAVPGKIVSLNEDRAIVDMNGNRVEVCTVMTPDARPDEWVLVHAGFAIGCVDESEAMETWKYLRDVVTFEDLEEAGESVEGNEHATATD